MENEDLKLKPYDRLQSIFSEKNTGKLTESGASKLDYLLNIDKKPNIFSIWIEKIKSVFSKMDGLIFSKGDRKNNTGFHRRKKQKDRWT